MTTAILQSFHHVLRTLQLDLEDGLRNREGLVIERSADAFDQIQHATERELAIGTLHRETGLLRNVQAALARIDEGDFGNCLRCNQAINPKRLHAVPWALYCIRCQDAVDVARLNDQASGESDE